MSTKKKYKTCFQDDWLSNPKYSVWLEKGASDDVAKCKICSKTFSVAGYGNKSVGFQCLKLPSIKTECP